MDWLKGWGSGIAAIFLFVFTQMGIAAYWKGKVDADRDALKESQRETRELLDKHLDEDCVQPGDCKKEMITQKEYLFSEIAAQKVLTASESAAQKVLLTSEMAAQKEFFTVKLGSISDYLASGERRMERIEEKINASNQELVEVFKDVVKEMVRK